MSPESTPIPVYELTQAIKNQLEGRFKQLAVQGEISNLKRQSSGHLYFDLKDRQAKISCVFFKNSMLPGEKLPKEGDSIVVYGSLAVYPPHGKYQIIVKSIELAGIGALLAELQKLKEELKAAGYFEKKRSLPPFPKRIGVVTSPTGAVIRDIINVLSRRLKGFHLILSPVRVQGEGAAEEIAAAVRTFNKTEMVDVIIVGRGGGSLEDLWAFNERVVAEALFESTIPIVSAVGHETDVTIADFVADRRAPTPSAAAEIVSQETQQWYEKIQNFKFQIDRAMMTQCAAIRMRLENLKRHPLMTSPFNLLAMPLQRADELRNRLDQLMHRQLVERQLMLQKKRRILSEQNPLKKLGERRQQILSMKRLVDQKMESNLLLKREQLTAIQERLSALDPRNVLKRGYSILLAQKGRSAIVSTHQLERGDHVSALLADGERELVVHDEI